MRPASEATERAVPPLEVSWEGTQRLQDDGGQDELNHLHELVSGVLSDRRGPRTLMVGIRFVDADEMSELNREHMGHQGATDVLSFPIDGDPLPVAFDADDRAAIPGDDGRSTRPMSPEEPPWMLGDIVICPSVAAANAPDHAGTYHDELALLVVHGLLHLMDMNHAEPDERAAMQARERELLDFFHGPLARDPWTA
jgi:probable rRNA maturation factor